LASTSSFFACSAWISPNGVQRAQDLLGPGVELLLDLVEHHLLLADHVADLLLVVVADVALELGLEARDLVAGDGDAVHGVADPVHQATLERLRELDPPDRLRHPDAQPSQPPLALHVAPRLAV